MGCGKAHPAQAATSVDEPQRREGEKWPSSRDQPAQVGAGPSSGPRTAVSPASDAAPEGPAGLRAAAFCESGDVSLHPPKPPPPPSAMVKGSGESPSLTAADLAARAKPLSATTDKDALRAAVSAHLDNLSAGEEPFANAPLVDNSSLRAAAAAGDSALNHERPGPPEAPQPSGMIAHSQEAGPVPGSICTTPRGQRGRQENTAGKPGGTNSGNEGKKKMGKAHVGKAFEALGTSPRNAMEDIDIDSALAMLSAGLEDEDEQEEEDFNQKIFLVASPTTTKTPSPKTPSPSAKIKFDPDVPVAPASRVMVLMWAKWARNSLRIRAEQKLKELQHVRYPKTYYSSPKTPPLSPQPTPRGGDDGNEPASPQSKTTQRLQAAGFQLETAESTAKPLDSVSASGISAPPPSRTGAKKHPGMAQRGRAANGVGGDGRLLFDVMAEERKEAQDAAAMKKRLQKNFQIEEAHTTGDGSTPGFGVDTPSWGAAGAKSASRMSPKDSVVSSGVASPMAGGQMSPWLLEAEALVNGEDDYMVADNLPTLSSNAWGFEPSKLFNVPETVQIAVEEDELNNSFIADGDELDAVGVLNIAGLPESRSVSTSPTGLECEGQRGAAEPPPSDSMASTATSPASFTRSRGGHSEKDSALVGDSPEVRKMGGKIQASEGTKQGLQEYAIGSKVSYWSSSRGVWLAATVVEKKSSKVYVIDKQNKGCLAKVRASELISAEEQKEDPVLRALAAFDTRLEKTNRAEGSGGGTPRGGAGTPRGANWQPPAGDVSPRGSQWQPPSGDVSPRGVSGKSPRRGDAGGLPPKGGSLQKASRSATSIRAELPPALAGVAGPVSRSPRQPHGRIVRDDFSDDSDDN